MDPQLSGFALGLLFGAAKIGLVGTVAFGVAWWRARAKLERYERLLPEPGQLEERLGSLEQASEYTTAKLTELVDAQAAVLHQLRASSVRSILPVPDATTPSGRPDASRRTT
jgi:hypothetical protein